MEKQLIEDNFQHAISYFDFKKVREVMEFLDWTWYGKDIPTVEDMVETCRYLLKTCIKDIKDDKYIKVETGGFEVTLWQDNHILIEFILTKSESAEE